MGKILSAGLCGGASVKSFLRGRLLLLQSFQVLFHFEMQIQKLHRRVSGCNHSSQTLSRQPRVLVWCVVLSHVETACRGLGITEPPWLSESPPPPS